MTSDSTRTLLFGLFVASHRMLTAAQVIALAEPLGISTSNVKSHLTRMVADGALRRSGPKRKAKYWPSAGQARVVEDIAQRLQYAPAAPWDGTWLMLTLQLPAQRALRERLQAELWFDGFRPWGPNCFARPAWPVAWAVSRACRYLERAAGRCLRGKMLIPLKDADLNAMYRIDEVDLQAKSLAQWIGGKKMPKRPGEAFAARMETGGRVARLIGHDPRLPAAIWAGRKGLQQLVTAYRRFEQRITPRSLQFLKDVLDA